jgi:O-antigen/teichoic acid export membrane protein
MLKSIRYWQQIKMSIKRFTLYNYLGQFYIAGIGILVTPTLVNLLGKSEYGMVSILIMIQTWLQILDMGLSNTVSRESTRYVAGVYTVQSYKKVMLSVIAIFASISLGILLFLIVFSSAFASSWLTADVIDIDKMKDYVVLIAGVVSIRFFMLPFRSMLVGLERHKWIMFTDISIATIRSPICVLYLYLFCHSLDVYFIFQLSVSMLQLVVFVLLIWFYFLSSKDKLGISIANYGAEELGLKKIISFSSQMIVINLIWLLISQFDKLVLSNFLNLANYGGFNMAITVSNTVLLLSSPFSIALLPRLVALMSQGDTSGFECLFKQSAEFIVNLLMPIIVFLIVLSRFLLFFWTGDDGFANQYWAVVSIYSAGNLFLVISAHAYYVLYVKNMLKRHVYMNIVSCVFIIPIYVVAAMLYGCIGTALVWLIYNVLVFLFWVRRVEGMFFDGFYQWFCSRVILQSFVKSALVIMPFYFVLDWLPTISRLTMAALFLSYFFIVAAVSIFTTKKYKEWFLCRVKLVFQ